MIVVLVVITKVMVKRLKVVLFNIIIMVITFISKSIILKYFIARGFK